MSKQHVTAYNNKPEIRIKMTESLSVTGLYAGPAVASLVSKVNEFPDMYPSSLNLKNNTNHGNNLVKLKHASNESLLSPALAYLETL
jgi:hypothetical protein